MERQSSNETDLQSDLAIKNAVAAAVKPFKLNIGSLNNKSSLGSSATPSSFASTNTIGEDVGDGDDDEIELGEIVRPKTMPEGIMAVSSQFAASSSSSDQSRKLWDIRYE